MDKRTSFEAGTVPHGNLESVSFELTDPADPTRILRGVIDQPAGSRERGDVLPAVLVLHGFKGFFRWGFFPEIARRVAAAGFAAVRFNFSGSGVGSDLENFTEDAAFEANTPSRECEDAVRVIEELGCGKYPWISRGAIGLVGHSMGGAIALLLAGRWSPRPVHALVTWAAVSRFDRLDPEQVALLRSKGWIPIPNARTGQTHRLGRSWLEDIESTGAALEPLSVCREMKAATLLLHGTEDTSVAICEGEALCAALPPGVGRLERIDGAGHTFGATQPLGAIPDHLEDALGRTLAHLCKHLPH